MTQTEQILAQSLNVGFKNLSPVSLVTISSLAALVRVQAVE